MRRILILPLLTTGAICLQAASYSAVKIDLDGRKDNVAVTFTNNDPGLNIFHPGWVKPEAKRNCYLQITGKKRTHRQMAELRVFIHSTKKAASYEYVC